uniref:Uncharacterized protein n=1 Tax=Arundo donax TaxID=35708 RepID=A0A0A9B1Q9_ARUDO
MSNLLSAFIVSFYNNLIPFLVTSIIGSSFITTFRLPK